MKVLWLSPPKILIHTLSDSHKGWQSLSLFKMTKPNSSYMQMGIEANNLESSFLKKCENLQTNKHKLAIN